MLTGRGAPPSDEIPFIKKRVTTLSSWHRLWVEGRVLSTSELDFYVNRQRITWSWESGACYCPVTVPSYPNVWPDRSYAEDLCSNKEVECLKIQNRANAPYCLGDCKNVCVETPKPYFSRTMTMTPWESWTKAAKMSAHLFGDVGRLDNMKWCRSRVWNSSLYLLYTMSRNHASELYSVLVVVKANRHIPTLRLGASPHCGEDLPAGLGSLGLQWSWIPALTLDLEH